MPSDTNISKTNQHQGTKVSGRFDNDEDKCLMFELDFDQMYGALQDSKLIFLDFANSSNGLFLGYENIKPNNCNWKC